MSKKPPIKAVCPAGCLWETVHKEDWENGTTYIEQYVDGNSCYLEVGKQYKIFTDNDYLNVSFIWTSCMDGGSVEYHTVDVSIPFKKDKFKNCVVFKVLDHEFKYDAVMGIGEELTFEYEIERFRYIETIQVTGSFYGFDLPDKCIQVLNTTKVLQYNDDATITLSAEDAYTKEEIETIIDEKITSSITEALGGDY